MKFTNYDKAIMIGLTLGDGYIDPKGMLQITHCDRKKEYLTFKAKLLHSVVGGKNIKVINILKHSIYKKNGSIVSEKTLSYFRIRRQSTSFMLFRNLLYPENKKMITSNTLDLLAPISIAIWWMDDGCLTEKYVYNKNVKTRCGYILRLRTYLSKSENELIQKYFIDKYDVKWNVVKADGAKDNTQWMLRCGTVEGKKFLNIIREIILLKVPSMSYKVINI